jgi:hypothetical protein
VLRLITSLVVIPFLFWLIGIFIMWIAYIMRWGGNPFALLVSQGEMEGPKPYEWLLLMYMLGSSYALSAGIVFTAVMNWMWRRGFRGFPTRMAVGLVSATVTVVILNLFFHGSPAGRGDVNPAGSGPWYVDLEYIYVGFAALCLPPRLLRYFFGA